jgi:hypothetical protein
MGLLLCQGFDNAHLNKGIHRYFDVMGKALLKGHGLRKGRYELSATQGVLVSFSWLLDYVGSGAGEHGQGFDGLSASVREAISSCCPLLTDRLRSQPNKQVSQALKEVFEEGVGMEDIDREVMCLFERSKGHDSGVVNGRGETV